MNPNVDFPSIVAAMRGREVARPNRATDGTLSGHAAGEPFEDTGARGCERCMFVRS